MGKRGPRPKNPEVARLEGNPGKREIFDSGIEAAGDVFIPDHLHEDAQACIEVIRQSMPPKVYARVDSFLLSAFAAAWALHKLAAHTISAPGFSHTVPSARGGDQPNAWIRILNDQAKLLASLGDRLALNPHARSSLKVAPEENKPASKFAGLLNGQSASSGSSRH